MTGLGTDGVEGAVVGVGFEKGGVFFFFFSFFSGKGRKEQCVASSCLSGV